MGPSITKIELAAFWGEVAVKLELLGTERESADESEISSLGGDTVGEAERSEVCESP
jgi:hypothetical protein